METEYQRRVSAARFRGIINDNQTCQVWEPLAVIEDIFAHRGHFDHKNAGTIVLYFFIQGISIFVFDNTDHTWIEYFNWEEINNCIRSAANHRADKAIQSFKIYRQSRTVKEILFLGIGCIMRALNNHLLEHIHQVVPLCFFNVTLYTDYVAELAQFTDVIPQNQFVHQIDLRPGHRWSANRIIMGFENIRCLLFSHIIKQFIVNQCCQPAFKLLFFGPILIRFGILMRKEHQWDIGITRNKFFKLEDTFIDLCTLKRRIIGLFAA